MNYASSVEPIAKRRLADELEGARNSTSQFLRAIAILAGLALGGALASFGAPRDRKPTEIDIERILVTAPRRTQWPGETIATLLFFLSIWQRACGTRER